MSMRTNAAIPKRKWKENSMLPKPKKKREAIVTDYLLEKRIEKDDKAFNDTESHNNHKHKKEWNALTQNMDQTDKVNYLIEKARQIEQKAKMIDQHNKLIDQKGEINGECDDLLIDALQARLAALTDV